MFSLIDIPYIQYIEIEPTTFCNAGCPLCSRHKPGTSDVIDELVLEHLPKNILQKIRDELDLYQTAKQVSIFYCGNYGDAIMHPEFEWLYEFSSKYFKSTGVHTNGGARSTEFWKTLGTISKEYSNAAVTFAIDGLQDTNHLYRRNVKWEKLMLNVQTYLDAGGVANWKYLVFDHNKHQVDEARELAKKLGFENFTAEISTRQPPLEEEIIQAKQVAKKIPEIEIKRAHQPNIVRRLKKDGFRSKINNNDNKKFAVVEDTNDNDNCISCRGIATHNMFLNPKGRIWPCCFLSEEYDTSIYWLEKREPWLAEYYRNDFNNLNNKSLEEIFTAPAWKEMTDAWSTKKHELRTCWKQCKNSKWKVSNTAIVSADRFKF